MSSTQNLDVYAKEAWINTLKDELVKSFGKKHGLELFKKYHEIFDYLMISSVDTAVLDIIGLERCKTNSLATLFEPPQVGEEELILINIYSTDHVVVLSDSLNILQSMGLKVLLEKPKKLIFENNVYWIHRYQTVLQDDFRDCIKNPLKIQQDKALAEQFEALYMLCWKQHFATDTFNKLLFSAHLNPQSIQMFRAYAAYLKQIKTIYSSHYIAEALFQNIELCLMLNNLFVQRFNPSDDALITTFIEDDFISGLNAVESLDHDIIIKKLFNLIMATCRSNYFQTTDDDEQIISFKFISSLINQLPKPSPEFDVFIYCKRFEGIHLRGGKVARGGLRWSNRPEDYRTEVLGLMKAQMIKNALIVPTGSKGGFVCKLLFAHQTRQFQMQEVESCYRLYIRHLLNLTDNIQNDEVVHPIDTKIIDDNDPYLVVAADKGTASYSDIANGIAQSQNFWLDDAFASGGSHGYDHKKMGITARGAWESVKRHFRVLKIDCQQQAFSVIGIGDMSGDVFGNGMLLSKKTKLLAAFNHLHIFIDPNPNPQISFEERQRLFQLPRSSWNDYNSELISAGGGVFKRSSKKITLSAEIQQFLHVNLTTVSPNELINLILKSKADLLWNGGIGTYIKAESESHSSVEDIANDTIRVNGNELKVKMIGEGGNLGVTQAGRIEFALLGGDLYSDAIDNSAGVDCSDHEVNIKILLQQVINDKLMDVQQRNQFLQEMTDEVAFLTLQNNIKQTQIIDMLDIQAFQNCHEHVRYIAHLENKGTINRKLEGLPEENVLKERISSNQGLTKPEISVLVSHSKLVFKHALLKADCFKSPIYEQILINYFPQPIQQQYKAQILSHPLKGNIVATLVSNQIVNQLGIGFGYKMKEETGANIVHIVNAYLAVLEIFEISPLWQAIEDCRSISEHHRYEYLLNILGLIQRSISWILRNYPKFELDQLIEHYQLPIQQLKRGIYRSLSGEPKLQYSQLKKQLIKQKVPTLIIQQLPAITPLAASFDIADIALRLNSNIGKTAKLFHSVAQQLDLEWIKDSISRSSKRNHWHQLAIATMRNEVHNQQKKMTYYLLKNSPDKRQIHLALQQWQELNSYALKRYFKKINALKAVRELDSPMLVVAVSEVKLLMQQLSIEYN